MIDTTVLVLKPALIKSYSKMEFLKASLIVAGFAYLLLILMPSREERARKM